MSKVLENSIIVDNPEMVCVFCSTEVIDEVCMTCKEYKGIMTVAEWEEYTGEVWDEDAADNTPSEVAPEIEDLVCVFCDIYAENQGRFMYCPKCQDVDGLRSIADWENYTGEKWEN